MGTDPELGVMITISVRDLWSGTTLILFLDRKLNSPVAWGTGCTRLYTGLNGYFILQLVTGDLDIPIQFPNNPALAGLVLGTQGLALPTRLGFDTANGFELTLGH